MKTRGSITTTTTTSSSSSSTQSSSLNLKDLSTVEAEDVIFYAKLIGIDPIAESDLLWIAQAGFLSTLPPGWIAVEDSKGRLYYFDQQRLVSSWEHPNDQFYRSLVGRYRVASGSATATPSTTTGPNMTSMANLHFFDDDDEDGDKEAKNNQGVNHVPKAVGQKSPEEESIESVDFEIEDDQPIEEIVEEEENNLESIESLELLKEDSKQNDNSADSLQNAISGLMAEDPFADLLAKDNDQLFEPTRPGSSLPRIREQDSKLSKQLSIVTEEEDIGESVSEPTSASPVHNRMSQMGPIKANETTVEINGLHRSLPVRQDYEQEEFEPEEEEEEEEGSCSEDRVVPKLDFPLLSRQLQQRIEELRGEFLLHKQTFQENFETKMKHFEEKVNSNARKQNETVEMLVERIDRLESGIAANRSKINDLEYSKNNSTGVTEAVVKEKMEQLATELTKSIEERILKINSSMEESVQRYLSQVNSKQTDCRVNVEEEISALRSTVAGLVGCAEQSRQCEQMRLELQSTLGQVNSTVEQNSSLIEKIESRLESHRSQLKDNIERIDASVEQLVDQLRTKSNTTQVQELIETNRNQWLKKLESLQEKLESVDEKILGLEVQKSESKVEKPATTLATKSDDIQESESSESSKVKKETSSGEIDSKKLLDQCVELKQILQKCLEQLPRKPVKRYRHKRRQPVPSSGTLDSISESSVESSSSHHRPHRPKVHFNRLSQSTPNLYCSQHWRPQPNRRLATHLKSSKSSHTLDTRIVNIQESSKSLIGLIRQTSEELKSELASLRTLGNYNFTTVDNRTQAPSDTDTMQRLRSIRAVVNDRLKNMTVTIEQQKLTQI